MESLQDQYGRSFKTLRVSLLNSCNLACMYCVCGNEEIKQKKDNSLSSIDLLKSIKQLHDVLNLKTVRLTGGEPLLYPGLVDLVAGIRQLGIADVRLTTNGVLLERDAANLQKAGIRTLNVSLDAIDEDIFYKMSRRHGNDRIFKGIEAAQTAGIEVKINSVIMKGVNDSEILPLLRYAFEQKVAIRFLEIMAMGHLYGKSKDYFISQEEILSIVGSAYRFVALPRKSSSTSNYWKTSEGNIFGVIANESQPFCSDCNRLRLDSEGNIYGCLSSNSPISMKGISREEDLVAKLQEALSQKQSLKFTGSELSMLHIGG